MIFFINTGNILKKLSGDRGKQFSKSGWKLMNLNEWMNECMNLRPDQQRYLLRDLVLLSFSSQASQYLCLWTPVVADVFTISWEVTIWKQEKDSDFKMIELSSWCTCEKEKHYPNMNVSGKY